jgi:hypothetical protein
VTTILRRVLGLVPCAIMGCAAAPVTGSETTVAPKGVTDVAAAFGNAQVSVKITTHEVDIGAPSDQRPEKMVSSCTYSRFPCSPIDSLEISVNGNALFVARSVYADLADVGVAGLSQTKKGQIVLTLGGGDASESYTVKVTFDEGRVRQRTLMNNEAREVVQRTLYLAPAPMD